MVTGLQVNQNLRESLGVLSVPSYIFKYPFLYLIPIAILILTPTVLESKLVVLLFYTSLALFISHSLHSITLSPIHTLVNQFVQEVKTLLFCPSLG